MGSLAQMYSLCSMTRHRDHWPSGADFFILQDPDFREGKEKWRRTGNHNDFRSKQQIVRKFTAGMSHTDVRAASGTFNRKGENAASSESLWSGGLRSRDGNPWSDHSFAALAS